jgi:hypothetical protein
MGRRLINLAIMGLAIWILWTYFGESTISATLDGKSLERATVEIDGEVVGTTPYTTRLSVGVHHYTITPPASSNAVESYYKAVSWTLGRGVDVTAEFDTKGTQVELHTLIGHKPLFGALVYVDGVSVGTTPITVELESTSEHEITVYPPEDVSTYELFLSTKIRPHSGSVKSKLRFTRLRQMTTPP